MEGVRIKEDPASARDYIVENKLGKEVKQLYLAGVSTAKIADHLREKGHPVTSSQIYRYLNVTESKNYKIEKQEKAVDVFHNELVKIKNEAWEYIEKMKAEDATSPQVVKALMLLVTAVDKHAKLMGLDKKLHEHRHLLIGNIQLSTRIGEFLTRYQREGRLRCKKCGCRDIQVMETAFE